MGQLDEAIRAHLELKRKHGATEEELQAEEQEALGPVRRDPVSADSAAVDPPAEDLAERYEPAPGEAPELHGEPLEELPPEAFHEALEPLPSDDFQPPPEVLDDPGLAADPGFADPNVADPDFADPDFADPAVGADAVEEFAEHAEEPSAFDEPDPVAPPEPAAGQTPPRGFKPVREPPLEGAEEKGEDVLEETPDFLQETPEHDRLWFEQKPPRDFDFDDE